MSRVRKLVPGLALGLSLGLALGFLAWTFLGTPEQLGDRQSGLAMFWRVAPWGLLAGGLLSLAAARAAEVTGAVARGSALVYVSAFKALGVGWAPLLAVVAVSAAVLLAVRHRGRGNGSGTSTLLLHCMGCLSGLYLAFHAAAIVGAWPQFQAVLAALFALVSEAGSA